jgi:hypothetical protein
MDINSRAVEQDATGLVRIHPDESGSTAWFGDVLANSNNNGGSGGGSNDRGSNDGGSDRGGCGGGRWRV